MALTNQLSYSLLDDAGNRATLVLHIPTGLTIAQYTTFSDSYAALLDAVTGSRLMSVSLTQAIALPGGLKADALADHFNNQGANFAYSAANTGYRHTVRLPAIRATMITDGAVLVGDQAIIDWEAYHTAGNAVVLPTDRDGNDLTAKLGASLTFRK